MNLRRILPILIALVAIPFFMKAQVTTSSISGTVTSDKGEGLDGASIVATHVPSGTVYSTIARKGGTFNIPNMRVGGPYTIVISFVGLKPVTITDVTLTLGEPYNVNPVLSEHQETLSNILITGTGTRVSKDKTGASTNINTRMITSLPTFSRSISDFSRLTPQSSGNSFLGRDGRLNNVTVDGANLNNNFGLTSDPLPGGGGNPVSLDAIEEVSVNIAPYDVRQANFTGANIAAVTKSGTNRFKGTLYTYYRNQSFQGLHPGKGVTLNKPADFTNKTFGGSLGGPIIKDKLFFFANYEHISSSNVLNYYTPTGGQGGGNISQVPVADMEAVANYLKTKYNYDPGAYQNFNTSSPITSHSLLAKIDWNISKVHKLTLKYNDYLNARTFLPSGSGNINGSNGAVLGAKFSNTAMAFGGTVYTQNDKVKSGSLELSSNISSKFANQFLATYTKISTTKDHPGAVFPFVDILKGGGSLNNYISFGNEPFNGNFNIVNNDVLTITDNFTYFAGKNTLTAGASYEYQKVGNGFMRGAMGYYIFSSVQDFLNDAAPIVYAQTYSLIKGQEGVISANLKVGQLGIYAQDEIAASPRLKITAGVRVDKPVYPEQPLENAAFSALSLMDANGNPAHFTTGSWPDPKILVSPRVGFRWTPAVEKNLVIRGGTGIFTGRIPFVYLTNIPSNSLEYQMGIRITDPAVLANLKFNPDPHAYNPWYNTNLDPSIFPTVPGGITKNSEVDAVVKNFKFPQVWRTDLGVDKQFGHGWSGTIEAIFTKDLHDAYMFNANLAAPNSTVNLGGSTRPAYSNAAARIVNPAIGSAIILNNTSKGYSFSFTTQLNKAFTKGLFGSVAYTYTIATDVTANPGSQAGSAWVNNETAGTQNTLDLSYSSYMVPHRVVANISYRFEYLKHLGTTISLFYQGSSYGSYSYIYNGDVNNDGNSKDLMYIPKNASEITFAPYTNSGVTFTSQQQSDAFFKYISQDPYLSKHQGQVAKRNAGRFPFYSRVDMKLVQDIFTNIGQRRNTIQVSVDMINALNFFDHNLGVSPLLNGDAYRPLKPIVSNGQAVYNFASYKPVGTTTPILMDQTFVKNRSIGTTWSILLGVRYIF